MLGRPLFTQVAPCLNNFMVAQRFEDAADEGSELDDTIDYVLTLRMLHVPFKGPSEAVTALLGNQVSAMFATASVATPLVEAGKLRALAVTSPQRMATLPAVPTLAEAGVQGLELREWEGMVAPAGTPGAIIEQWNHALFRVLGAPQVRARLADLGMTVADPSSSDAFGALIGKELDHWGGFVRDKGLRPA